jgi:hypothetical protein
MERGPVAVVVAAVVLLVVLVLLLLFLLLVLAKSVVEACLVDMRERYETRAAVVDGGDGGRVEWRVSGAAVLWQVAAAAATVAEATKNITANLGTLTTTE